MKCPRCDRGREACQYCEKVEQVDWEVMCDCGLYDFGDHLTDCEARANRKYVIAADHSVADLPREA